MDFETRVGQERAWGVGEEWRDGGGEYAEGWNEGVND